MGTCISASLQLTGGALSGLCPDHGPIRKEPDYFLLADNPRIADFPHFGEDQDGEPAERPWCISKKSDTKRLKISGRWK
jgi:hypothetical protein